MKNRNVTLITESDLKKIIHECINDIMINESFEVLGTCKTPVITDNTKHQTDDREERDSKIASKMHKSRPLISFVVDTNHPNGLEVHTICDNCTILISNKRTGKLITKLIPRPGQIARYFDNMGKKPDWYDILIRMAKCNQYLGRNNW